jgi:mannose-6-phosphate isomerase
MSDPEIYPLKFKPVYKNYLWGGTRIPKRFNRTAPEGLCAESWEVSDHPDGMSVAANGPLAGRTLAEIVQRLGPRLLGTGRAATRFPLLIKLIDAAQPLSVQVHPDNQSAPAVQGEPKTEMWYFLEGAPEAAVWCGLQPGVTAEKFQEALRSETLTAVLRKIPATPDTAVFVPGGRVHAIDAGCLILEIQQSSNTTYRVYDWGRTDADGKPRELHLEKALQVIRFKDCADPVTRPEKFEESGFEGLKICESPYFRLDRFEMDRPFPIEPDGSGFQALFIATGEARIEWPGGIETAGAGTSLLIPSALRGGRLIPGPQPVKLLRITEGKVTRGKV